MKVVLTWMHTRRLRAGHALILAYGKLNSTYELDKVVLDTYGLLTSTTDIARLDYFRNYKNRDEKGSLNLFKSSMCLMKRHFSHGDHQMPHVLFAGKGTRGRDFA